MSVFAISGGADAGNYTWWHYSQYDGQYFPTGLGRLDRRLHGQLEQCRHWAGGAIPDVQRGGGNHRLGYHGHLRCGVAGTTNPDELDDAGTFQITGGALTVSGAMATAGFNQTGGTLSAGTLTVSALRRNQQDRRHVDN